MRLTLATIVLLATSSIASAKEGAYVSANVGLGGLHKMDSDKHDAGFRGGFALGYNINDSFAVEFNLQHQSNNIQKYPSAMTNATNATIGFVNGYYFLPVGEKFKPYVGAGIGYGSAGQISKFNGLSLSYNALVLQGIVGAKYELCANWDVFADLTYGHGFLMTSATNVDYRPYGVRLGAAFKL
jgi:opacity protein-like surface antigen